MASVFHGGPGKKPPKRHKIAGARISCVLYLCKPLFQGNTKGNAWLNPFYFLSSVCVCVCAPSYPGSASISSPPPPRGSLPLSLHPPPPLLSGPISGLSAARPVRTRVRGWDWVPRRGGSNRAISQAPVQPTVPQGVRADAEAGGAVRRAGARTEEQGRLSKRTQREGSC